MTCMDCHETSPPPHPMIPTSSILPHPISSIAPNSSSHFTPCLPHQPRVIPQSYVPTPSAHPSHKQHLHVPCHVYNRLYIARAGLTCHQASCTAYKQLLTFGVLMPSTLPYFPPSLAWTWIASLDIIGIFHFGLPHPHSYHHIPYVFPHRSSTCFTYPFNLVGRQSIQHSRLAYIFVLPLLMFVISATRW